MNSEKALTRTISIIDPVGVKAGMDLYDINLCTALNKLDIKTILISNFEAYQTQSFNIFNVESKGVVPKVKNIVFGHLKAYNLSRRHQIKNIVLHSFSFEIKDFIVLLIAKFFSLKVILILHDVSGFAKKDNKYIRNLILNRLANKVVVHNKFSQKILFQVSKKSIRNKTAIIKHGAFTDNTFKKYKRKEAISLLKLSEENKYILFFGQIKKVKGLDILIKAMGNIKKNNVKLIIAGKPWEDSFFYYQQIISELNIDNKIVKYIEYISEEKRDLLFSLSELIVLPYREIYQSGVLLMTMSNKIPAIASNLDPFKEIIQKDNGLLFDKDDYRDLTRKIEYALDNPNKMKNFADNAYALMKTEYSWENIAKNYQHLIE